jgi:hypothetical protein
MKEIILLSKQYKVCPICAQILRKEEGRGYTYDFHSAQNVKVALCFNPLASDPLHSYCHIIDTSAPDKIAYQEFALDLGNKYVLFANNYQAQTSSIKNNKHGTPFPLPFIVMPNFSDLTSLKNKIRTVLVFS